MCVCVGGGNVGVGGVTLVLLNGKRNSMCVGAGVLALKMAALVTWEVVNHTGLA